jgi:hypothetical protein
MKATVKAIKFLFYKLLKAVGKGTNVVKKNSIANFKGTTVKATCSLQHYKSSNTTNQMGLI